MSNDIAKFVGLVPMDVSLVLMRKAEIAKIGKEVMKKADFTNGIYGHYGVIPGTKTNCLLKAGAQLLCMVFHICPKYETKKYELEDGHREYESICNGYQIGTNIFLGQGVGSCSTLESKYRYRYEKGDGENTGKPLPGKYWGEKKKNTEKGNKAAFNLIGGKGFFPKKLDDGRWMIFKKTESKKIPNPDIADQYNTVKKQSNKRALVDMVLQVLAAGDMFTQDQYEKIIDKLELDGNIDVPWSYVEEPETKPKEQKSKNFNPKSFSQSQTSSPEKPSQKPPAKEENKANNSKPEETKKTETPKTTKKAETKKEKESEKETPTTTRNRVIALVESNKVPHEKLLKLIESIFPNQNTEAFLNVKWLPNSNFIPDSHIMKMDNSFREAGLYE
jgi:hypothetical protein